MGLIKQRISVTITLEVDVDDWNRDYGSGDSAKDIREDVKAYAQSLVSDGNDNWKVVSFK